MSHISVMKHEALMQLCILDDGTYIDMTFGAGGHSKAILDHNQYCRVIAVDRDPAAIVEADKMKNIYGERFNFLLGNFSDIAVLIQNIDVSKIYGILFDFGVSSMQLDQANRGFSFMKNGSLDMRMNQQDDDIKTAFEYVNYSKANELADIIYYYGGEKRSRQIANAIVEYRKKDLITDTKTLANIICRIVKRSKDGLHPATRSFQALRIKVNDELQSIENALQVSVKLLSAGGRIVAISFHSLEDRIVKNFFRQKSGSASNKSSRYVPELMEDKAELKIITKKVVRPSNEEVKTNVRSRSAKMRVAERMANE